MFSGNPPQVPGYPGTRVPGSGYPVPSSPAGYLGTGYPNSHIVTVDRGTVTWYRCTGYPGTQRTRGGIPSGPNLSDTRVPWYRASSY
eukprot:2451194-Rhodomonas_salina.1